MRLGEHQQAFSKDIVELLKYAFNLGYDARLGEFERPVDMQKIYFKTGRSKTMDSNHLSKCAADIHFVKDGKICYPKELGDYWESLDPLNSWGGNWKSFKDAPHVERRWKMDKSK